MRGEGWEGHSTVCVDHRPYERLLQLFVFLVDIKKFERVEESLLGLLQLELWYVLEMI